MFRPKLDENEECRSLHNEELDSLYSSEFVYVLFSGRGVLSMQSQHNHYSLVGGWNERLDQIKAVFLKFILNVTNFNSLNFMWAKVMEIKSKELIWAGHLV